MNMKLKISHVYLSYLMCTSVSDRRLYPYMWEEYNASLRSSSKKKRAAQWYDSTFSHPYLVSLPLYSLKHTSLAVN